MSSTPAERAIDRALHDNVVERWPFESGGARPRLRLEAPTAGAWLVAVNKRRVSVARAGDERAATTVRASAETLLDVVEGRRSGVDAWMSGDLTLRGNIALALKLEGLLDRTRAPPHFPTPRHVDVEGVDTFYLDAGRGDPTVVLLHGLGATNASMLPTLRALSRSYRVIAPDLPGFGDSAKPIRAYHAPFYAQWAAGFLDALGVRRAHFVGNSMGGRIAIELALAQPDRVERLALLAPAVAMRRFRQFVPIVRIARPELAALPLLVNRQTVLTTIRMMFSQSSRVNGAWFDAAADEFIRVFRTRRGRMAFFSAAREIYLDAPWGERGFWKRLSALEQPALFLWGDRDVLVPAAFSKHVETALPGARSIVLGDCGHVPQFEHPDLTHRVIRRFLV